MKSSIRCLFAALMTVNVALAEDSVQGFGPWRFGMSKSAVSAIKEFGPYQAVRSTGGLETFNGKFGGEKTNISFVFQKDRLHKIQIWMYEGKEQDAAIAAWWRVRQHLRKQYKRVETPALPLPQDADREAFQDVVASALSQAPKDQLFRLQTAPEAMPKEAEVFSTLFRHPVHGFYVFLYYVEPQQPPERDK